MAVVKSQWIFFSSFPPSFFFFFKFPFYFTTYLLEVGHLSASESQLGRQWDGCGCNHAMQTAAFSSYWALRWGVLAMLQRRAPIACSRPSAHNSFVGALSLSASSFWQQSPGRHSTGAWSVDGGAASLPVKAEAALAPQVSVGLCLGCHSFCSFAHPFISGCLVASSPAKWGAVLCSLQVSLPYFLLHPVGFGEAVGFLPPRFLALLLSEFLLFSKFAATFCSLGWKMQTSPCKLVFHLGRCDFLGGVVFCSEVSLCNSHKLFLSNLVLAWMKPAWKWERVWNCSNLGKRRRALLVSSLIFLCFLRETQFKSLHSSFVPSATGFRWSGECWFSSAE